ncbi:MAG: ABC transporter ATP-binding protein [Longimicrobiales bacterium]
MSAVFEAADVVFAYAGARRDALDNLSMRVPAGSLYAIIGPNGSGKSTLLKLLLGVARPRAGVVYFGNRDVGGWERRELARRIGVVAQIEEVAFPITVHELVSMGRYPHLGPWRRPGRDDHAAIEQAMERCEVTEFAARPVSTLSGGERQRVRLARALAQQPTTLVLDEPTASLDIAHEMSIFDLLADLRTREGATVIVVTHHLNLAARYADYLLLLDQGRVAAEGPPAAVLDRETVERVYRWPVAIIEHTGPGDDTGAPQVVPLAKPDKPKGEAS